MAEARSGSSSDSDGEEAVNTTKESPVDAEKPKSILRKRNVFLQTHEGSEADKWTLAEKRKLLEGLKRYNRQTECIAKFVGTKTIEEVDLMVQELMGKRRRCRFNRPDPKTHAAPIDKWLGLIGDITFYDKTDYSEFLSVVMSLIARNEEFAASSHPHLDWKRIYLYLAALLSQSPKLPDLSDIESAIILDLMDNLGSSLRDLDTTQQRRLMDFKYQLLETYRDSAMGKKRLNMNYMRSACALKNELWEVRTDEGQSGEASQSPSKEAEPVEPAASSTEPPPTDTPSTSRNSPPPPLPMPSASDTNSHLTASTSSQPPDAVKDERSTPQTKKGATKRKARIPSVDEIRCCLHDLAGTEIPPTMTMASMEYKKSKLFTLNPMAVPASLLPIKKKKS